MTDPELIYLDHNATTPLDPAVVDAMLPWLRDGFANPSSDHRGGRRARYAIDDARAQVAALVDAEPHEVFFTSGGTESNNLALLGWLEAHPERPGVVTTTIEHPAVTEPCTAWSQRGHPVHWVAPGADGRVDPTRVATCFGPGIGIVSVMLANNETGAIQPLRDISRLAGVHGVVVHSDAAQAVGKMPVSMRDLGIDMLTLAGHKFYGPKGIGALVVRGELKLAPLLRGAGQERGLRPGTENVPSIVGLGHACALAAERLEEEQRRHQSLTSKLWERLQQGIPDLVRTIEPEIRLPNTLHVRLPGRLGRRVLARASGVAASTGSACHEGVDQPSAVLLAMGIREADALASLRLSVGRSTTMRDIHRAADQIIAAAAEA